MHEDRLPTGPVFSAKAIVTGGLASLCIAIGSPYGNMVIRGSYLSIDFSTAGALFLFFLLTGFFNALLRRFANPLALGRRELIVVYIMMIVASAIPTMGLSEYLLTIITGAQYFATPENEWGLHILPYLPQWMVPQDPNAVKWFFEGAPSGGGVPWEAWVEPLCYWALLIIALYLVMISSMVILRRQWVDRERLIYPLVQVPLQMAENKRGEALGPFFKSPIMWAGFVLPVFVSSCNALHAYLNYIPAIQLVSSVPIFRNAVGLIFRLSFPMVGFSYLINLDIAFSLWFFNTIAKLIRGGLSVLGVGSTEKLGIYGAASEPILAHQGQGALMVLVFFGLWVGREHLGDVVRKAFKGDDSVDDSGEMLSYRAAVFIWLGGVAVMTLWLWQAGLPLWAAFVTLLMALHIFVGSDPGSGRGRCGGGGGAHDFIVCPGFGGRFHGYWPCGVGGHGLYLRVGSRHPYFCHGLVCPRAQARRGVRAAFASAFLVYAIGGLYQFARVCRHDSALGLRIWGHKSQ